MIIIELHVTRVSHVNPL